MTVSRTLPSPSPRRLALVLAALVLLPALTACGGDTEHEITDVRRTEPAPTSKAPASWGYRLPRLGCLLLRKPRAASSPVSGWGRSPSVPAVTA